MTLKALPSRALVFAISLGGASALLASPLDGALESWESEFGDGTASSLASEAPAAGTGDVLSPKEAFPMEAWHDGEMLYIGIEVEPNYYIYRDSLVIDSVSLGEGGNLALGEDARSPEGVLKDDPFFGETYTLPEAAVIRAPLPSSLGDDVRLHVDLAYQGCAEAAGICFPIDEATLDAPFSADPPSSLADAKRGDFLLGSASNAPAGPATGGDRLLTVMQEAPLPVVMGLFFLAGLALTFTPCVLPMLPILSSIVVGRDASQRRAFVLSSAYVTGVMATYTALGVTMGIFGGGLNLQGYLQSPGVLLTFAGLFVVLALLMAGVLTLPSSGGSWLSSKVSAWQDRLQAMGVKGTVAAGAISVLVVSPCVSAPLAAALVFISTTGDAWLGGLALLALSAGMSLPLLLAGTFGSRLIPKAGPWMDLIKMAFAFMLGGVAIWLVARLVSPAAELALWGMFALLVAGYLWELVRSRSRRHAILPMIPALWGMALLVGAGAGSHDPLKPLSGLLAPDSSTQVSASMTVDGLADLRAFVAEESVDKPVMVKFTADWCASCRVMERRLQEPEVAAVMEGFTLLSVDVTRNTPDTREVLHECDLFGPPGMMFFHEGDRLSDWALFGEVASDDLREHLERLSRATGATAG